MSVSSEWLVTNEFEEIVFSQGLFNLKEIREQTVITIENHEERCRISEPDPGLCARGDDM